MLDIFITEKEQIDPQNVPSTKHPLISKYKYAIIDIKYFGFKTKLPSEYTTYLLDKCNNALLQIEQNTAPNEKNKLTLFELGRLEDLAKLKYNMDKYNEMGLIKPSRKLRKLYSQVNQASEIFAKIEEQFSSARTYKSGDILMTHSKKSLTVKNKSADNETALTHTFISKYGHATQIYIDPDTNESKLSHIYGGYQSDKVKPTDAAMSDVYRIDPIKLIPKEIQAKLEIYFRAKGLDYKTETRILFEQNTQKLHHENQTRFGDIKNDKSSRFYAGLADFGLYGGHTISTPNDDSDAHKEMYGLHGYKIRNRMICSEFVARSLVAALHETNENLVKSLAEEEEFKTTGSIIHLPLKQENYNRIHPQRLIELLHNEGCLFQVKRPKCLELIVNQDDLTTRNIDENNLKKPIQIFYDTLISLAKEYKENRTCFKMEAIKVCESYTNQEKLELNFTDPMLLSFLDKSFSELHEEINNKPSRIVQFFRAFASFLGFKPKAQSIVEATIDDLENIQAQAIASKYSKKNPMFFDGLPANNHSDMATALTPKKN